MKEKIPDTLTQDLYKNFQKVFRTLNFTKPILADTQYRKVTPTQLRIISFFHLGDVVHISEISRIFGMSLQSVNNLVKRLEIMGYVKRSKNEKDKRLSDIKLTKKGRDLFDYNRLEQIKMLRTVMRNLEPSESKALNAAMEMVSAILQKGTNGTALQNSHTRKP